MFLQSKNKEECTGCGACVSICPQKCIEMKADDEGFLYPAINEMQCIKCRLCERTCPNSYGEFSNKKPVVFAGVHNEQEVIHKSASGGAFTAIYNTLLKQGFIAWGVKYDENLKVIHDSAKSLEECEAFRKSKYVQSDTNGCYSKIEAQLKVGEKILFTGTPCQCAALRKYLDVKKVEKDNLIVVDLICHGVPNQELFDDYIKEMEERAKKKVVSYTFKNKLPVDGKINSRTARIAFEDGEELVDIEKDPFLKGYYSRLFYRPSCEKCEFASPQRVSDLTIGDAWHIENIFPEWDSLKGVSLMLANNEKGQALMESIKAEMTLKLLEFEWAVQSNAQLREPTQMHRNRKKFFKIRKKHGFKNAVEKATKRSFVIKALSKIKTRLKRIIKR